MRFQIKASHGCTTVITFIFNGIFLGVPVFATDKKVLPIPGQVPGIRVEMQAHYIVVALDTCGTKIKWDGKVQIER